MDGDSMPAQTQSVVRPDPDPAGEAPHVSCVVKNPPLFDLTVAV